MLKSAPMVTIIHIYDGHAYPIESAAVHIVSSHTFPRVQTPGEKCALHHHYITSNYTRDMIGLHWFLFLPLVLSAVRLQHETSQVEGLPA